MKKSNKSYGTYKSYRTYHTLLFGALSIATAYRRPFLPVADNQ